MSFPVEEHLPLIRSVLSRGKDVLLSSPPGSGKTTCVPAALLDEEWLGGKKIIMLEPRRIAARSAAQYIASKMRVPLGGKVGYRVRLEKKVSRDTRLEIITEGLLQQKILSDMELSDTGLVIFDEFHERSLQSDLAFALTLEIKKALRPDLRIMVMSATLDVEEVNGLLKGEIIRSEGRLFNVERRYLGDVSLVSAVNLALKETSGDMLVFLPGEREIKSLAEKLSGVSSADVLELYGSLDKTEQDRVFSRSTRRKVILATSIAETSLTIEGIRCVIDSGLMRVSRFSPSTGMTALVTLPLSLDRAIQREGRAGRLSDGVCYKLWTQSQESSRPAKASPEITAADLAALVLTAASFGVCTRDGLEFLTPPPEGAWNQAVKLLRRLGALSEDGRLTEKGERMSQMPLHPRLANMLLSGDAKSPYLAALLEENVSAREIDIRYAPSNGRVSKLAKMFARHLPENPSDSLSEGALLALAYPDRIACCRGNGTYRMVNGRGAFLPDGDMLSKSEFIVCCRLDERALDSRVFLACPIERSEIELLYGAQFVRENVCEWDDRLERVKAVERVRLGEMTIEEKPSRSVETCAAMLSGIRRKGVENMPCWTKESLALRSRINFAWQMASDEEILAALEGFLVGVMKWKDLEKINMTQVLDALLASRSHSRAELDAFAPERIEVPSGSRMLINYEGAEPVCEVRLQECFGMKAAPKVAGGRVSVLMTLLSPAMRPCAVTKDLSSFWANAYPLVRKDLRGRYPKHYWPEDPLSAVPTRRTKPKQT